MSRLGLDMLTIVVAGREEQDMTEIVSDFALTAFAMVVSVVMEQLHRELATILDSGSD